MSRKLSQYALGKPREAHSAIPSANGQPRSKKRRTFRERLIVVMAGLAVIYCGFLLGRTFYQTKAYEQNLSDAKAENAVAVVQQREVAREHQQLEDPDYLEGVARRDYRYSKPGEIVFILKDEGKQIKGFEHESSQEEDAQGEE